MSGIFALIKARRFAPLFVTQFLGAFNDNLYKNALVILLTFQAAHWTSLTPGLLANLAAGLFILPFFLFSATAGQLADKIDRARLARWTKALEIAVMALATLGFWSQDIVLLFVALFLMGLQSTLFGPVKYAILPQHLRPDELLAGNAWIEAATFVAILLGALAGALVAGAAGAAAWVALGCVAIAVIGYLTSRSIPAAPAPEPLLTVNRNPLAETAANLRFARSDAEVFRVLLGISWFWLYGALLLAQFPALARDVMGGGESAVSLLLMVFTLGIGLGSFVCQRLSGARLELGLVLPGALLMTPAGADLAWSTTVFPHWGGSTVALPLSTLLAEPALWRVLADLGLLGLAGGLYIVPLYTQMQLRAQPSHLARIVAANNILNAGFMVGGALAALAVFAAGASLAQLLALAALLNGGWAVLMIARSPIYGPAGRAWLRRCCSR